MLMLTALVLYEFCNITCFFLFCVLLNRKETAASRSITNSPVDKKDKDETVFQVSYPSAFSKLTASRQLSPLLMSQSCWSSR